MSYCVTHSNCRTSLRSPYKHSFVTQNRSFRNWLH